VYPCRVIDLGFARSRWTWLLGLAALVVGATGLPRAQEFGPLYPSAALLLVAAVLTWYWSLEVRLQREAPPKLRIGGFAALVLLLALLYGLLVAALQLPEALEGVLVALLLAVVAASVATMLCVGADLALRGRYTWARMMFVLTVLAFGLDLALPALGGTVVPAIGWAPWAAAFLFGLVAVAAPLDRIVELDRRERLLVLLGFAGVLVPLGVAIGIDRLLVIEQHRLLTSFSSTGAMLGAVYALVVLARSTLALPGARAYERKARELDAVYDFGLTARSAFDPERLEGAVLDATFRVAEPDVALVVTPDPKGDGCRCIVQRDEGQERHRYRFGARCRWQSLADHFSDRRPLVVVDHEKAQPGALESIWEPSTGS